MTRQAYTWDVDEDAIDELVLIDAWVHIEHLGHGRYMVIAENTNGRWHLEAAQIVPLEVTADGRPLGEGDEWQQS